MGDIYSRTLPFAFPWVILAPREDVASWVSALMSQDRVDCPSGSSFAVDVVFVDIWRLWMSQASYNFLSKYLSKFDAESTDSFLRGE